MEELLFHLHKELWITEVCCSPDRAGSFGENFNGLHENGDRARGNFTSQLTSQEKLEMRFQPELAIGRILSRY